MEPQLREGDRLLVDLARRTPATGLVVKRVEIVPDEDPPRLRLLSANPDYPAYTCLAEEAHVVGKVLWTVRKVEGAAASSQDMTVCSPRTRERPVGRNQRDLTDKSGRDNNSPDCCINSYALVRETPLYK